MQLIASNYPIAMPNTTLEYTVNTTLTNTTSATFLHSEPDYDTLRTQLEREGLRLVQDVGIPTE